MIEPFMITNPHRKMYKFFFHGPIEEESYESLENGIKHWCAEKGYIIKRQLGKYNASALVFEYRIWLQ